MFGATNNNNSHIDNDCDNGNNDYTLHYKRNNHSTASKLTNRNKNNSSITFMYLNSTLIREKLNSIFE